MNYNIHPILVHFPLAILGLYGALEVLRFNILTRQVWYRPTKIFLVIVGALATWPTAAAGDYIKDQLWGHGLDRLITFHAGFAALTIAVFNIIALAYVILLINNSRYAVKPFFQSGFWRFLSAIQRFVTDTPVVWLLALIGLCTLSITGGLGGSIVYGPDNDPFAHFIFNTIVRHY